MDYFANESINVYLHDRVYVSIAAISQFPSTLPIDEFNHEQSGNIREINNPRYKETLHCIKLQRSLTDIAPRETLQPDSTPSSHNHSWIRYKKLKNCTYPNLSFA